MRIGDLHVLELQGGNRLIRFPACFYVHVFCVFAWATELGARMHYESKILGQTLDLAQCMILDPRLKLCAVPILFIAMNGTVATGV